MVKLFSVDVAKAGYSNFIRSAYISYQEQFPILPSKEMTEGVLLSNLMTMSWSQARAEFKALLREGNIRKFKIDLLKAFATLNSNRFEIVFQNSGDENTAENESEKQRIVFGPGLECLFVGIFAKKLEKNLLSGTTKKQKRKFEPILRSLRSFICRWDSFAQSENLQRLIK